jgi:hypothetical protein
MDKSHVAAGLSPLGIRESRYSGMVTRFRKHFGGRAVVADRITCALSFPSM